MQCLRRKKNTSSENHVESRKLRHIGKVGIYIWPAICYREAAIRKIGGSRVFGNQLRETRYECNALKFGTLWNGWNAVERLERCGTLWNANFFALFDRR